MINESELQATLLTLCREAMASLNLSTVLKVLAKHAQIVLGADDITVALIEPQNGVELLFRAVRSIEDDYEFAEPEVLPEKSLAIQAYRSGKIVTSNNYLTDSSFEHDLKFDDYAQQQNTHAAMIVPLLLQNEVIALIGAGKNVNYEWTEQDLERAEQFAPIAAGVIRNAQTFQELETLNKQLLARNQELEIVQDFNQQLRGSIELQPLLERAVALVVEVLNADAGALHLPDKSSPGILYRAVAHNVNFVLPNYAHRVVVGKAITGQTFSSGQTIIINDIIDYIKRNPGGTVNPNPQWQAIISIPVIKAGKTTGVLSLFGLEKDKFSAEQVRFAEIVAGQIASAISQVSEIEAQKESERIAAALILAKTAAHELSQPLTLLQLELDIASQFADMINEEAFERMKQAISLMAERLKTYQKLTRLEIVETTPGFPVIDWEKAIQNN